MYCIISTTISQVDDDDNSTYESWALSMQSVVCLWWSNTIIHWALLTSSGYSVYEALLQSTIIRASFLVISETASSPVINISSSYKSEFLNSSTKGTTLPLTSPSTMCVFFPIVFPTLYKPIAAPKESLSPI